jgi:hypothetical protein
LKTIRSDQQTPDSVLEQIDRYRLYGYWSDDEDNRLSEDFKILQKSTSYSTLPKSRPTFEVTVVRDTVQANVIPTVGDYLIHKKGLGQYSIRAERFVQRINDRATFLNYLAANVLENIQADFFHQNDLNSALLHLLPIQAREICNLKLKDLKLNYTFKLDKKLISKISDLMVECRFGIYPFGFFLPSKRVLVKQWVKHANENGIATIKDQCDWIKEQLYKRLSKWNPKDRRCKMIKPLLDVNANDIKSARRAVVKK